MVKTVQVFAACHRIPGLEPSVGDGPGLLYQSLGSGIGHWRDQMV